ncbi:MAG: histidine kinase [Pseudonocardiales bacterium]|nr:MAG: histidine kinase [Pseudonocardiales bacterium]
MELEDYTHQVHDQLTATAALADERTAQIAATLAASAVPVVRLAIMTALAAAAEEITVALLDSPGAPSVTVRLDGDEVRIDVSGGDPEPASAARTDDGDATARISLRLSESLKADVETAAGRDGISVNTWLVRAAGTALSPGWSDSPHRRGNNRHRVTGWING